MDDDGDAEKERRTVGKVGWYVCYATAVCMYKYVLV